MSKEAMKLALEALENSIDLVSHEARNAEELYGKYPSRLARIQGLVAFEVAHEKAITALREALAEQPAEPVIWGVDWGKAGDIPCVSIIKRLPGGGIEVVAVEYAPYEYNPPAQRTWVGLTDGERNVINRHNVYVSDIISATEAKLKEKNT